MNEDNLKGLIQGFKGEKSFVQVARVNIVETGVGVYEKYKQLEIETPKTSGRRSDTQHQMDAIFARLAQIELKLLELDKRISSVNRVTQPPRS